MIPMQAYTWLRSDHVAYWAQRTPATAFEPGGFKPGQQRDAELASAKIRCPRCAWQPDRRSRWFCLPMGAPEFFANGCGHSWNTFDTRGRCPGCSHQWQHTSCHQCTATSPHEDWYERASDPSPRP